MRQAISMKIRASLERAFPEKRLFLRSENETRFLRLSPLTQCIGLTGSAMVVGWTIIASAILLMDSLGAGDIREQARRGQALYEERLNNLAAERDSRASEAVEAQRRFTTVLSEVSAMQSRLLASEDRRRELETGIEVIQSTLRDTIKERDLARDETSLLQARLAETEAETPDLARMNDIETTVDFLTAALTDLALQRDEMEDFVVNADEQLDLMVMEARLHDERNERIFTQIEDAVATSLTPLDEMFNATGLPTDSIINQIKRSYSGQGGPLMPINFSTSGDDQIDPMTGRANEVLLKLDQLNLYRIAAEKIPFAIPLKSGYRFTSGFGTRWGRPHKGSDFAAAHGTPIYATADGVITHASRISGYGNLIKIRHEFGIETRYAHLSKIRVKVGQRVSRGERIGDMGNTGRSTGTHLHYEVRVDGKAVNPMTYIKAARDVF